MFRDHGSVQIVTYTIVHQRWSLPDLTFSLQEHIRSTDAGRLYCFARIAEFTVRTGLHFPGHNK